MSRQDDFVTLESPNGIRMKVEFDRSQKAKVSGIFPNHTYNRAGAIDRVFTAKADWENNAPSYAHDLFVRIWETGIPLKLEI